jgi:pimeloyl-ACP methyl ester carboxylesterase
VGHENFARINHPSDHPKRNLMGQHQQRYRLPDRRRLGFDEHGDPAGTPIFYFHGTPGARVELATFAPPALVDRLGLRLITPDRPGMGLSDFQPGRRVSDWPKDVLALADHLGLERFGVLGYSGGTLYAMACAALIPDRLTRVVLAGVVGPFDKPGLTTGINPQNLQFLEMCRERPLIASLIQRLMGLMARFTAQQVIKQVKSALPPADQAAISTVDIQQGFLRMVMESSRRGGRGPQHDSALMISPWDFDPAAIKLPVQMWQGAQDRNAPPAMAEYLAGVIPGCDLQVYPAEGHVSIIVNHIEEILVSFLPHHTTKAPE